MSEKASRMVKWVEDGRTSRYLEEMADELGQHITRVLKELPNGRHDVTNSVNVGKWTVDVRVTISEARDVPVVGPQRFVSVCIDGHKTLSQQPLDAPCGVSNILALPHVCRLYSDATLQVSE